MAIEVFNRYEYKYFLDCETYKKISGVLDAHIFRILILKYFWKLKRSLMVW